MTVKPAYWKSQELVMIGVFAAAIKLSSLLIALAGGGMNPVTLMLKNLVFTTLLIVLLAKVKKSGTLLLFTAVSMTVSVLLMGGSITLLPAALFGAIVAELAILLIGGFKHSWTTYIGVAVYDLGTKIFSIAVSYIMMRETPALVLSVLPIIFIGYTGCLLGLFTGYRTLQELRHAGMVRS
ncbi:putative uncharacterized protein [Sutterella sp. CAG:521]|nr:putative uncharacterized protein [Sutterella sp. CAG:521]